MLQRMNLLPAEYNRKRREKIIFIKLSALWAFIFLLSAGFIMTVELMERSAEARLASYDRADSEAYENAMTTAVTVNELRTKTSELKEVIEQLQSKSIVDIDDVLALKKLIPDKINVTELEIDSISAKIQGSAPNAEAIADLYNAMDESELFSQITIDRIARENKEIFFHMSADKNDFR